MRFLILILIFINIGAWTYLNQDYFYRTSTPSLNEEVAPEKLALLTPHQLETLNQSAVKPDEKETKDKVDSTEKSEKIDETIAKESKPETKPKEVLQCFQWGNFNESNVAKAQSIADNLGLTVKRNANEISGAKRYWVYLPPAASAAEARQSAEALNAKGITDLYIINGPKWKNAISFGVFQDKALADKLLANLKSKGVQNVTKTERGGGSTTNYQLVIQQVPRTKAGKLKARQKDFPDAKLKTIRCQ